MADFPRVRKAKARGFPMTLRAIPTRPASPFVSWTAPAKRRDASAAVHDAPCPDRGCVADQPQRFAGMTAPEMINTARGGRRAAADPAPRGTQPRSMTPRVMTPRRRGSPLPKVLGSFCRQKNHPNCAKPLHSNKIRRKKRNREQVTLPKQPARLSGAGTARPRKGEEGLWGRAVPTPDIARRSAGWLENWSRIYARVWK